MACLCGLCTKFMLLAGSMFRIPEKQAMKRNNIWITLLFAISLAACTDNTKKEYNETPPPQQDKIVVHDTVYKDKEGTSIKINDNGVSFEDKDGSKKTNVKISTDSSSLEISRPK